MTLAEVQVKWSVILNGSLGSRQFLNVANERTCFASYRVVHSFETHFWLKSYLCLCSVLLSSFHFVWNHPTPTKPDFGTSRGSFPKRSSVLLYMVSPPPSPGIVNRTQSNSIHGLDSIEFGNRTKSNTELCVREISEPIELNRTNRIQSNLIY